MKRIVESFDEGDSAAIKSAQIVLREQSIKADLSFIHTHCQVLLEAINRLQSRQNSLSQSIELFDTVCHSMPSIDDFRGDVLKNKV